MDQPTTEPALRALEPLVGRWAVQAAGRDGQPWPSGGHATFEWHPSRAHLVQRTVFDLPGAPDSTSIIGCDGANGTYVQLYSDERGVSRIYAMRFDGREWTLQREGEPFAQRFVGTISDDGCAIAGRWEKAEDSTTFTLDFYLTYQRIH
jgi:hypothetical protein